MVSTTWPAASPRQPPSSAAAALARSSNSIRTGTGALRCAQTRATNATSSGSSAGRRARVGMAVGERASSGLAMKKTTMPPAAIGIT
jgi:hypothetical protein